RRFWKRPGPRDPSPPPQPSDSIPSVSTSTFTAQRTGPGHASRFQPTYSLTPTYPGYLHDHAGCRALVGPVTQVLDVLAEISEVIKTMRDGKRDCDHLLFCVTMFLDSFVNELKASNVPIPDGSPTAVRLFALKSNLKAIKTDVKRWSEFGLLDRYLKRDEIKTGLLMHGENLMDCLNIHHLMASVRTSNLADSIEQIVFPGPSVLVTQREEGEPAPSALQTATLQNLQDFLQRPVGWVVFEQIAEALRDHLEEAELGTILMRTGPRSPPTTLVQTGHNHPISYLATQISELTVKVDSILPDLAVPTETQERSIGWRNPAHQLSKTVSITLELLNELHNTAEAKLNVATLADKMSQLSLNLSNLVILHRAGQDLSRALREAEEATRIYLSLVAGQPEIFCPDLASSFIALSACRSECGLHEDMLTEIEWAVDLYRTLVTKEPDNLSIDLLELGHCKKGLEVILEAVRIYRWLAAYRPNMFCPYLTRSLNNLSAHFSESGCHEALTIHRPLAAYRPNVFRPHLAGSLNILSTNLSQLGHHKEALEATDRPNVFRANFACSVHNFAARLSEFGRRKEALQNIEEAVSIYCPLVVDCPDVFRSLLALSLGDLSIHLSGFGRHKEALKASEEVVGIYRLLAADQPEAFHPDLTCSLGNFSLCLSKLSRHHKAIRASEEAGNIYRPLAMDLPDVFLPDLAHCLCNLSALKANAEAVNIYHSLAADRPVFRSDFTDSLHHLSICLSEIGHRKEALAATEEALTIYRPLTTDRPDVFRPDLTRSLGNFSIYLSEFACHREALEACEEAVNIYRPLAADLLDTFHPDLAHYIGNLSGCLSEFGRHADALDASNEVIRIYHSLTKDWPDAFYPDLSHCLSNLSVSLSKFDCHEEAVKVNLANSLGNLSVFLSEIGDGQATLRTSEETVSIYCLLVEDQPDILHPHLAHSLGNLSVHLSRFGHDKDALEKNEEAENMYCLLLVDQPDVFGPNLANTLRNTSLHLSELGRHEEALGAIEEAMNIYCSLAADRPSVFSFDLECSRSTFSMLSSICAPPAGRVIQEPAYLLKPDGPFFITSFAYRAEGTGL
ncbi:hypothetical protein BS47DRAFT_1354978, partial [Hydnum rufescens UP504]